MTPPVKARRSLAASLCVLLPVAMTSAMVGPASGAPPLPDQAPVAVAAANPNPAHAGDTVTFDGTGSYDAETPKDQLTYLWTFPDGSTQNGYRVSKRFDQAGVYDVVLKVSDKAGSDTDTVSVEVDDTAPVAEATATPSTSKVEQQVTLDASASRDAETPKDQLDYSWDVDSDGDEDATGMTVAHAYDAAGAYKAKLTVTDPQGARATDVVDVTVTNSAPSAAATATPNPAATGQAVTFDASGSSDAETTDGSRLVYEWDFGDGGSKVDARGMVVEHAFPSVGVRLVTLTVRDPQGLSDTAEIPVTVQPNSGPTAVAKANPTSANLDDDITFDGSESSDPETPKDQLTYSWDFGDGGTSPDATTAVATFPGYSTPGTKTATLTVSDAQGNKATDTVQVQVGNEQPVADATATPNPAKVDNAVTFDGTGSSDAETPDSQLRYEWDFGDGTPKATTPTVQHVYDAVGVYTVTLKVKDAVGSVATDTISLQVENTAPSAAFTATPNPVNATQNVVLDATGTTDGESDRSRLTFTWDFGDGGDTVDATGPVVSHSYPSEGANAVTLTVRDPHGGEDTATTPVVVLGNNAPTANATATPSAAKVSQAITFDGSESTDAEDDADAEPLTYLWTFPDGTTASEPVVTKAFTTAGDKEVTLKVTDSAGLTSSRAVTVQVTNTAPIASATSTGRLLVNRTITFDGSSSTDEETPDELTYAWAFGDGTTATGARVGKRFTSPGLYSANLTVTDPQGLSDTMTLQLWVAQSVACQSGHVARAGSWRVVRSSAATGRSYCDNLGTGRGADRLLLRAVGPRVAVTYAKSTKGGLAEVYVDGELEGRINFRSTTARPRFGYTRTFTGLGSGAHTVKLVMVRGAGYVDELLVWGKLLS